MELHPSNVSVVSFYIFAAVIVASALSVVTVAGARRQALSFFLFSLGLGGLIYLEAGFLPAVFVALLGVASAGIYWGKTSRFAKESDKSSNEIALDSGPNRPVAFFISLCLVMVLTPIWGYSIWRGHQVEKLPDITSALWSLFTGDNVALALAVITLIVMITVALLNLRPAKISPERNSEHSAAQKVSSSGNQL